VINKLDQDEGKKRHVHIVHLNGNKIN